MKKLILLIFFVLLASTYSYSVYTEDADTVLVDSEVFIISPGPRFPPTRGEVWPKPQNQTKRKILFTFSPNTFVVKTTKHTCGILQRAITRFQKAIQYLSGIANHTRSLKVSSNNQSQSNLQNNGQPTASPRNQIKKLLVELNQPCEAVPYFSMDEKYSLTIAAISRLRGDSIWGILRGLETASQLFYLSDDYTEVLIKGTTIIDFPSYPHRGLLLDTARHYISPEIIFKMLDAMAMNKMNVFHWHIVDDQSFPYQSSTFPELSEKGAFAPMMVYNASVIKSIIAYANDHGIRVLPEIDVPGHTRSWGISHPEILTQCYGEYEDGAATIIGLGPMHPLRKITYKFIKSLFDEVQTVFPDSYVHIGGDEVDLGCWLSNPDINKFMKKYKIKDIQHIHAIFILKVLSLLDKKTNPIVWQEVFDNNVLLPNNSLVQIWKSEFIGEMVTVLNNNQRIILSAPWYLDNLGDTFSKMYSLSPRQWVRRLVAEEKMHNIVGGEACMWGEMADDTNVLSRTWPRASALAELLWSPEDTARLSDAVLRRAEEHTCRMRRRGVPAEPPAGPGFCLLDYNL